MQEWRKNREKRERQRDHHIIAVGYEIDFSPLQEILKREVPTHAFDSETGHSVKSGVWYSDWTKGVRDCIKSTEELTIWFNHRKGKDQKLYVSRIYVSPDRPGANVVVGDVICGSSRIYVFFINEKGVSTSLVKREINSGNSPYRTVDFDRIELPSRAYLHEWIDGKNVITY
jgi:hypothetical protein